MAISPPDCQAGDSDCGESDASQIDLPRKASFGQLLARYLQMGFLSCFGLSGAGPEQPTNKPNFDEQKDGALQRQMSRALEVPHDELASTKDEPYAQVVESYGPESSVPASFRAGFLGAGFDNEFSLTNGVKWQVWQKPGEPSAEALEHFQSRPYATSMADSEIAPMSPSLSDSKPPLSPHSEPSPALSPQGNHPPADFQLPPGVAWDGWGESLGAQNAGVGFPQGLSGGAQKVVPCGDSSQYQEDEGPSAAASVAQGCTHSLSRSDVREDAAELDTSDGAALLSKLGAPHTIPLTPEIEEELRRSGSSQLQGPEALARDVSFGSPISTPGSAAAGPHSDCIIDHLFRSSSSPSTHTKIGDTYDTALQPGNEASCPPSRIPPLALLTKSLSASTARVKAPMRSQSLRSEGSCKMVKETHQIQEREDDDGHKTVNQYVKLRRIGTGSYGKVVLHRDSVTGKLYAMKILHRSRLMHVHISGEETAWTDVLRETAIMKQLDHPNLVSLQEVIDDPDNDKMYMVLEYEEKGPVFEGTGPEGGIGEEHARTYIRDVLSGLQYLHYQNIVHGDIKPDNLLMSAEGRIKIGDFGVSHIFENENDQLRRTPGTPAFTAPECCLGKPYRGKPADMWALGCTLYVFVTGRYPFMTESNALEELYHAIAHQDVAIPAHLNPDLQALLRQLLEKDPAKRATAEQAAQHPWLTSDLGPLPQVELRETDVSAEHLQAAMTQLDDASKSRLARLFARHAAALRCRKASGAKNAKDPEIALLSRTTSIKSTDAYDSDFSAPSSRYGSPKRDSRAALSARSSRFGSSERSLNPNEELDGPNEAPP